MIPLKDILRFLELLNTFQSVERVLHVPNRDRMENDVEHSYQLAMLAWYISDANSLSLDTNLLITYALVHDFVEVYAGDTYIYSTNENDHISKEAREHDAQARIEKEFPEFKELHHAIREYEKRENPESKFIYVLDKLHPVFQVYLNNGYSWKEGEVTLEMLIDKKKDKMQFSKDLIPYWEELLTILQKEENNLFHKSK